MLTPDGARAATGSPRTSWLAGHARLAHLLPAGASAYLRPWIDLGIVHGHQDGYAESGAGDFGLRIGSISQTLVTVNPMLEVGTAVGGDRMTADLSLRGGVLGIFGGTERSAGVRLVGVGPDGPGFTITDETQPVLGMLGAGLQARIGPRATLEANVDALLSSDQQDYSGALRLTIAF